MQIVTRVGCAAAGAAGRKAAYKQQLQKLLPGLHVAWEDDHMAVIIKPQVSEQPQKARYGSRSSNRSSSGGGQLAEAGWQQQQPAGGGRLAAAAARLADTPGQFDVLACSRLMCRVCFVTVRRRPYLLLGLLMSAWWVYLSLCVLCRACCLRGQRVLPVWLGASSTA